LENVLGKFSKIWPQSPHQFQDSRLTLVSRSCTPDRL